MEYPDSSVLLVDDEPSILSAMRRLLRPLKCQLHLAESGDEGLALLEQQSVDLVISDMRMPQMSGDVFLAHVAERWPDTERMVMTGYTDTQAAIDAINKGKITRFMTKPWQDDELVKVVSSSFELSNLRRRNAELQQANDDKQAQLERLNHSLEEKVAKRTEQLEASNASLANNYRSMVKMFSALTARRMGQDPEQGAKFNKILLLMAKRCAVADAELKQLFYAWQLRNIGKLSFDDSLLKPSYVNLAPEEQRRFHQHPLLAQAAMNVVKPLYPAGQIVRQHKEYLDGSGYPAGLEGEQISASAKLLCVVNDFVELISGRYQSRPLTTTEALEYLNSFAAERYDEQLVNELQIVVASLVDEGEVLNDQRISSLEMKPGMVLTRDLLSEQGVLLLGAGVSLDRVSIERLLETEFNLGEALKIYISKNTV